MISPIQADKLLTCLTLIFPVQDDQILTLYRASNKTINPDKISVFGGKVEPGENIKDAALRELKEESGITPEMIELKGTLIKEDDKYINFIYLFIASGFQIDLPKQSDEGTISWMSKVELLNNDKTVEHIKLYLNELLESPNFYAGIITYSGNQLIKYLDSTSYYNKRL